MKNYVQPGAALTIPAPGTVASGAGVLVGSLFGVANHAATTGAPLTIATEGVFDLPKVGSQAWAVGALVYWDGPNNRCTTTAGSLKLIGVAAAEVGSGAGDTVGRVRLNGGAVN